MALTDGGTCAKWILITFNILFMIVGIALLAVGIWVRVDPAIVTRFDAIDVAGSSAAILKTAAVVLIVLGVVMVIVCLFGVLGACMENRCYLMVYIALVVLLVILQIAVVVLAIIAVSRHGDDLRKELDDFMNTEYDGVSDGSVAWDTMQINLFCCGVTNRSDFRNLRTPWYMERKGEALYWQWPTSCCVLANDDPMNPQPKDRSGCEVGQKDAVWYEGCHQALRDWSRHWGITIAVVVIVVILLQVATALLACCMLRGMKGENIH